MRARNRSSASSSAGCVKPGCRRQSAIPGAGRSTAPVASWPRASSRKRALGAPQPQRRWHSDWAQVPASGVGDVVTSQGQRFRRRALRRGYKVDEVDTFLDRVEATLAGEQVGPPVGAQEVHDVVFRVRFGGHDEWQVDLHLDRVERQLAELEDRGGRGAPAPDPMRDSLSGGLSTGSFGGGGPKQGLGAAMSGGGMAGRMAPPTERLPAPPVRDDRFQQQPPQRGQMPPDPYGAGRYDEPTGYGQPAQPQLPQRPAAP